MFKGRVCDEKLRFINIVSKWPGIAHDSFILENSALKNMFETVAIGEGWLLGDSAYPLRLWLFTPVVKPTTEAAEQYNRGHIKTRNTVERSLGVLKSRFRCLNTSGETLFYLTIESQLFHPDITLTQTYEHANIFKNCNGFFNWNLKEILKDHATRNFLIISFFK